MGVIVGGVQCLTFKWWECSGMRKWWWLHSIVNAPVGTMLLSRLYNVLLYLPYWISIHQSILFWRHRCTAHLNRSALSLFTKIILVLTTLWYYLFLLKYSWYIFYCFQVYNIGIQQLHTLGNAHHGMCSHHLSPYKDMSVSYAILSFLCLNSFYNCTPWSPLLFAQHPPPKQCFHEA